MSAAAPNPNKMILLAAVGIGVYWFMSRRSLAATAVVTPAGTTTSNGATRAGALLGGLTQALGGLSSLFNPNLSASAQAQASAVGTANMLSDANYAGADWSQLATSAVDGVPVNPPGDNPYDALRMDYLNGSGSLGD